MTRASAVEASASTVRRGRSKSAAPCTTPPACTIKDADNEIMAIVDIVRDRVTKDLSDKIGELTKYFDKAFDEFSITERMEIINAFSAEYVADAGEDIMGFPPINVVNRLVITKKHHAASIARTLI